jgi:hypothetical protein
MADEEDVLEAELLTLSKISESLIGTGKSMLETHAIYAFDLYCSAILNRTVNLTRGFGGQIRDKNFVSAAPLVRIHLDSLLRLFAAYQVEYNIDEFAKKVIGGQQINKLKDKHGQLMTDSHLSKQLANKEGFNWVTRIYQTGSEHVHFSSQHIFSSVRLNDDKRTVEGIIRKDDSYVPISEKIWATRAMIQITVGISTYIVSWIEHKKKLG